MHTSPFSPARRPGAPRAAGNRWITRLRRSLWWSITAVLTTLGVGAAFVLLGVIGALLLLGLGTAGTTLVRCQLRQTTEGQGRWPPLLDLLGGWSVLALVGLAAEFGAAGIGLSAAVAAVRALPPHRWRRREGDRPTATNTPGVAPDVPATEIIPCDPLPQPSAVRTLSTAEVCWAWRLSYVGMHRPDCPGYQREHLAALRSACLDELERRDPAAFRRWLPTARAAGDPARFFCPGQPR